MSKRGDDLPTKHPGKKKPRGPEYLEEEIWEASTRPAPKRRNSPLRVLSGIVGGLFLVVGIVGFGWFFVYQHQAPVLPTLPLPGLAPTNQPVVQIAPLLAEGITLVSPTQTPGLSQEQALLVASQLEADAAAEASTTTAQYVLLSYASRSTPAIGPKLSDVPAWMVVYQNIPLQPSDASVDPTPFPHSHFDLFVFLDATTGKELLTIWV